MGAYVVGTSSLNDKHSCQLFGMGLRFKTTPTLTTPLIRANMSCPVATIFYSLAFSFFVHLHGQPEPFGSCIILQFYSSFFFCLHGHLSCLLATAFSSLRFLSNLLSSPHFNLLRVARRCFMLFSVFLFSHLIFSLSFLCSSVSESVCFKFPISK